MRVDYNKFKMHPNAASTPEEATYLDYSAQPVKESDRLKICAYKDTTGTYVKVNSKKGLYDERDEEYLKLSTKAAKDSILKTFSFIKVPGQVYTMYVQYLRSKNMAFLRQAQREIEQGTGHVRMPLVQASQTTSSMNDENMKSPPTNT